MTTEQQNLTEAQTRCFELGNRLSAKYGTRPGQRADWNATDPEWLQAVAEVEQAKAAWSIAFHAEEAAHREKLQQIRSQVAFAERMADERNGL
jgi:hypothetical protein